MEAGAGLSEGSASKADAGSHDVLNKSGSGAALDAENGVEHVQSEEIRVAEGVTTPVIAPVTPLPVKEIRDIQAPRTVIPCRLAKIDVETPEDSGCGASSPCTPKQGMFDPFAPGPEDMCLAPKLQKKNESRVNVARQLDFDSLRTSESTEILGKMKSDEEKLLELVSGDILDVVVPSSTELDEAEKVLPEPEFSGFKTPPRVPCFNRTPSKCPDAPMKQGRTRSKRLHVDSSLCRKLEF